MANLVAIVAGVQNANLAVTLSDSQNNGSPMAPIQYAAGRKHLGRTFGTQTCVFDLPLQSLSNTYISTYQEAYGTPRSLSPPTSLNTANARKTQRLVDELDGYKASLFSHGSPSPSFLKDYRVSKDAFAESLRKYPASTSAHIIQQLLAYTQSKNAQKRVIHNRRSHIKRGFYLKRFSNKNIQTYTRSRIGSPPIDADDVYGNPIKKKRVISPEEKDANDEGPKSSSYDYLMIDNFPSQKTEVMYLSDVNRYVRDTFREVCNNDNLLCSDLIDRYCNHKKQCNLTKSSDLNKENSRTEPKSDFKTWRLPTPGYSSFDNNRARTKTLSDSMRMKILELKEKTSVTCKTLRPYDFDPGEDILSVIETESLTNTVGLWIQTVPLITTKNLDKDDIVKMLVKKINIIVTERDPETLPAIVTNAVAEELKNLKVPSSEKFEFARKLAHKINELSKKKNRLSQIVQDWIKTLPFVASTLVNIDEFASELTVDLKNLKNLKQVKFLKNVIMKTLFKINLNCDDKKREKLADELIFNLFNDEIQKRVNCIPLIQYADEVKLKNNLIDKLKALVYLADETDTDNLKNAAYAEISKLPFACDSHKKVSQLRDLVKVLLEELAVYPRTIDQKFKINVDDFSKQSSIHLGSKKNTEPFKELSESDKTYDNLFQVGQNKIPYGALIESFVDNLEKSAENEVYKIENESIKKFEHYEISKTIALRKKEDTIKNTYDSVLDNESQSKLLSNAKKNLGDYRQRNLYSPLRIPKSVELAIDSLVKKELDTHNFSEIGDTTESKNALYKDFLKNFEKSAENNINTVTVSDKNNILGLGQRKVTQKGQKYMAPEIYDKYLSKFLKAGRVRHEAPKSLKIDNNLMATHERVLLGDFLCNPKKSARFEKKYPESLGHEKLSGNIYTRKKKSKIKLPKQNVEIVSHEKKEKDTFKSLGREAGHENITEKQNALLGNFLHNLKKSAIIEKNFVGIATDERLPDNILSGSVQSIITPEKLKNAKNKIEELHKKEDKNYKNLVTLDTNNKILGKYNSLEKYCNINKSVFKTSAGKRLAHMNKTLYPRPENGKIIKKFNNLVNKNQRHEVPKSNNINNALRNYTKTGELRKSFSRIASKKLPENALTGPGINKINISIQNLYKEDKKNRSKHIAVKETSNRHKKENETHQDLNGNTHADKNMTEKQKALMKNYLYSLQKSAIESAAEQKPTKSALQGSAQTRINTPKKSVGKNIQEYNTPNTVAKEIGLLRKTNYETLDIDKNINEKFDKPILSYLSDNDKQFPNIKIETETAAEKKSSQKGQINPFKKYSGEAVLDKSASISRTYPKNEPDKRLPENLLIGSGQAKLNVPKITLGKNVPNYRATKISNEEKRINHAVDPDKKNNMKRGGYEVAPHNASKESEQTKNNKTVPKYDLLKIVEKLKHILHENKDDQYAAPKINNIERYKTPNFSSKLNFDPLIKDVESYEARKIVDTDENILTKHSVKLLNDYLRIFEKPAENIINRSAKKIASEVRSVSNKSFEEVKTPETTTNKTVNLVEKEYESANIDEYLLAKRKGAVLDKSASFSKTNPKSEPDKRLSKNLLIGSGPTKANTPKMTADKNVSKYMIPKVSNEDIEINSETVDTDQNMNKKHEDLKVEPQNILNGTEQIPYNAQKFMETDEDVKVKNMKKNKTPKSSIKVHYDPLKKDFRSGEAQKTVGTDGNIILTNDELLGGFLRSLIKSTEDKINRLSNEKEKSNNNVSQSPTTTLASEVKTIPLNEEILAKKLISSHKEFNPNFRYNMVVKNVSSANTKEERTGEERVTYDASNIAGTGNQVLTEYKFVLFNDFLDNFKQSAKTEINKISTEPFKTSGKFYKGSDNGSEFMRDRGTLSKDSNHFAEREFTDKSLDKVSKVKNEVTISGGTSSSTRISAENIIYDAGTKPYKYLKKEVKWSVPADKTGVHHGERHTSKDSDNTRKVVLGGYFENPTKATDNEIKPDTCLRKDTKFAGDVPSTVHHKIKDMVLKESNRKYGGKETKETVPLSSQTCKETKKKSSVLSFSPSHKVKKYETEDNKIKNTAQNLHKIGADKTIDTKIMKNLDQKQLNIPDNSKINKVHKYEALKENKNIDNMNEVNKNCMQIVYDNNALLGGYLHNHKDTEENKTTNEPYNLLRKSDERDSECHKHLLKKSFENQVNEEQRKSTGNFFSELDKKVRGTDKSLKKNTQQVENKLIASEENLAKKLKEAFENNVSDWTKGSLAPETKTTMEDMEMKRIILSLPKVLVDYELQDEENKDIQQQMQKVIYKNINNISNNKSIDELTKHKLAEQLLEKIMDTIDRVILTIEEDLLKDVGSTSGIQNYHDKIKIWFKNIPQFQTTDLTNKYKCKKLLRDLTKKLADTKNSNLNKNDQRKKNISLIKNKIGLVCKRNEVNLDPDTINKYASKLLDVMAGETKNLTNFEDQPYKINQTDGVNFRSPEKIIHSVPSDKVAQNLKKKNIFEVFQKHGTGLFEDISGKVNLVASNKRDHAETSIALDSNLIGNKKLKGIDCESLKMIDSLIWKLVQSNVLFSPGDNAKKREKVNELIKSLQTIQLNYSTEEVKKIKMLNYINNWLKEISKSANKPFEERKNHKLVTDIVNGIFSSTKTTRPGRMNKDALRFKAPVSRFSSSHSEVFYLEGSQERLSESKSLLGIKDICREINEEVQSKIFTLIIHNLDYLDEPENKEKLKNEVFMILIDDAKLPNKKGIELAELIFQNICKQSEINATKVKKQLIPLRQKIRRVMLDYPIEKEKREILEIHLMDMQARKNEGTLTNDINKDMLFLLKEKGHLNNEDAEEMLHKLNENIILQFPSSSVFKLSSSNPLIKDSMKSVKGNRDIPNKTDSTTTIRRNSEKDKYRYVDQYTHGLKDAIEQWIDNLPLDSNTFDNKQFKNNMIKDLIEDVLDWENKMQQNPDAKTSEAEERETLKNKCHIWMNKLFNGNNLTVAMSHTNELVECIRGFPVPVFGSEAISSQKLEDKIFVWINNLPMRTDIKENNHYINQYVEDLAKIIQIHKGDPDAEKKISHEISKIMQFICQNLVDLSSKDLESSFFNDFVKKEVTYDTSTSTRNSNKLAQENFNIAILGWLKPSPLYQVASPDAKTQLEEAAFEMAKSIRNAISVPYKSETDVEELLLGKIKVHLKLILLNLEVENDDDIINNIANNILNYFKGQEIFKNWTGSSEPLHNVDLLALSVDDWISQLPIDTKTVQEREVLNEYKSKLVSRLKQARCQFHPTIIQHEQAIRDESRKFLRTHITDLHRKSDKNYIEKMTNNLVRILIGVPIERLDTTKSLKPYKSPSDTLYEYIEEWINNFPVQGEGIKLNLIKQNLASKLVNKIGEINMSPDIFNDIHLYKDLLQDEIDKLIEEIPVNPEMTKYVPALKYDFVSKMIKARDRISEELAGKVYKQHLRDKISDLLPLPSALTLDKEASLELLKDKIADDFINIHFAGNNETLTDRCMKNMTDELNRFFRTILDDYPCAQLDISKMKKDLHKRLEEVSLPRDDAMKVEVEQARIRSLVNEWMKDLPLRQETASERLHRYKLAAVLANRIHHIEMEKLCNDFIDSEPKLYEEISRFLNKNFFQHDQEQSIPKHVQNLINQINRSEQSRKFISTVQNICNRYPCTLSLEDQDLLKRIKERRRNTCTNATSCFLPTDSCSQTSYESPCMNQQRICPEVNKPEKRDASTLTSSETAFESHIVPRAVKKECIGNDNESCNPFLSQNSQTTPHWLAKRAPYPCRFFAPMEQISGSYNSCLTTPFAGLASFGRRKNTYENDYSPLLPFPQVGTQTSIRVPSGSYSKPDVKKTRAEPRDKYSAKPIFDPHTCSRFAEQDIPCHYGRPCSIENDSESSDENENYPIAETSRFSRSQRRESCLEYNGLRYDCPPRGVKQSRLFCNEEFWNTYSRQHGRKDNNKCDCRDRILVRCKGSRNRYIDTCQACGTKCPHPTSLLFK